MNAATGISYSDPPDPNPCWFWWESTGVNPSEWYILGINDAAASTFFQIRTASNSEAWFDGGGLTVWTDLDGLTVAWFGQTGTSQCPGGDPGDVTYDIPP